MPTSPHPPRDAHRPTHSGHRAARDHRHRSGGATPGTGIANRLSAAAETAALTVLLWWHDLPADLRARYRLARASADRGSESVEKAVIVAAMLAGAIALALVIRSVVDDYSGMIE